MTKIIVFLKRPTPVHGKAGSGARGVVFGALVHRKGGFGAREGGFGGLVHEKGGFGAREGGFGGLVHEKGGFGAREVSESWIRQSTAYSTDNEGYHFCWYWNLQKIVTFLSQRKMENVTK